MSTRHWLIEMEAYDDTVPGVIMLYFSNGKGFRTRPGDTPAHKFYRPLIRQALNMKRSLFSDEGSTSGGSRVGFGKVVLNNNDGSLNALRGYGIDGRYITILTSSKERPVRSDFVEVLVTTMEQPEFVGREVHIELRDDRYQLAGPLQESKYLGSGAGTLEGAADMKGKPKPVLYGVVKNGTPPNVEIPKRIYQVSDGLVNSIDNVYDRGIPLQFGFPMVASDPTNLVTTSCATSNGTIAVAFRPGNRTFYTSTDLETWTPQQVIGTGFTTAHVVWAEFLGLFIFCGAATDSEIWTSPDGVTWTQQAAATFTGEIVYRLAVGASSIVAVGSDTFAGGAAKIWSSTDALTWTGRTTNFSASVLLSSNCAYGNGRFIVTSGTSSVPEAVTSTDDGVTWALLSIPYNTAITFAINADLGYFNGLWLVERNAGLIATSIDGETWALTAGPFPPTTTTAIISDFWYEGGIYYAFAQNVASITGNVYGWSADGITWRQGFTGMAGTTTVHQAMSLNGRIGLSMVQVAGAGLYVTQAVKTYASAADILDDAQEPAPGSFGVFLDAAGSYFRLGADPAGLVTFDATEGATSADRSTAQVLKKLLDRASQVLDASDVTAIDAVNANEIGFYETAERSLASACDEVARSIRVAWYVDKASEFRAARFDGPAAVAALTLTKNDLDGPPDRRMAADPGRGIPIWKSIVRYGRNYTQQTTDVAAGVPQSRRAFLVNEWREESDEDPSVKTKHLRAQELIEETLLVEAGPAAAEATGRLALRGRDRDRIDMALIRMTDAQLAVDLATTIGLNHDLVGGTHRYVLTGIEIDAERNRLFWKGWGPE